MTWHYMRMVCGWQVRILCKGGGWMGCYILSVCLVGDMMVGGGVVGG